MTDTTTPAADPHDKHWLGAGTAQTAIFLWQGFMDKALPGGNYQAASAAEQAVYDAHFDGLGQDGGAFSVAFIASVLEQEYYARWKDSDFPGVYHYDVIEPLGEWLATEGPKLGEFQYGPASCTPAVAAVVERYNEMMAEWLVTEKLTTNAP